jgi:hypothetical protein
MNRIGIDLITHTFAPFLLCCLTFIITSAHNPVSVGKSSIHSIINMKAYGADIQNPIIHIHDQRLSNLQNDLLLQYIKSIPVEEDTILSVFRHIAQTIKYDVALVDRPMEAKSRDELMDYVLRKKKGVCEHYSELLHRILTHFGYTSYLVSGYTRKDGKLDAQLGHTWLMLYYRNEWTLMDVTWASGYVQEGRFVARYDESWYKVPRHLATKHHIPFDPLWQLTDSPVSHQDIKLQPQAMPTVTDTKSFEKILQEELLMSQAQAADRQSSRIRDAGVTNRLIQKQLNYLELLMKAGNVQSDIDRINQGVDLFNTAVKQFNDYQVAKTKALKAKTIPSYEALEQLSFAKAQAQEAKQLFEAVSIRDASIIGNLKDLKRNTALLLKEMQKEEDWLQLQLK